MVKSAVLISNALTRSRAAFRARVGTLPVWMHVSSMVMVRRSASVQIREPARKSFERAFHSEGFAEHKVDFLNYAADINSLDIPWADLRTYE